MGFELIVRFSGACHFCPLGDAEWCNGQGNMGVLFPDAGYHDVAFKPPRALDGESLKRHVSFMVFDPRDLVPNSTVEMTSAAVWYFRDYRITFDTGHDSDADVKWKFNKDLEKEWNLDIADVEAGKNDSDMVWLAPLTKVCGNYYRFNHKCLEIPQPKPLIGAQVFLNSGELKTEVSEENSWFFGRRLAGKNLRRPLAHEVRWEIDVLHDELTIYRRRLRDNQPEKPICLAPHKGGGAGNPFPLIRYFQPARLERQSELYRRRRLPLALQCLDSGLSKRN